MRRERRLIWAEDRYELLGRDGLDRYYGRAKGDLYLLYRKRGDEVRRETVQEVDGERDWFWDSTSNRLIDREPNQAESGTGISDSAIPPNEHVLRGYLNSNRLEDLTVSSVDGGRGSMEVSEIQLESGATAILLTPPSCGSSAAHAYGPICEWVVSLHGGPESFEGTEIRYCGLYRELLRQGIGVAILNYRGSIGVAKPDSTSWKTSIETDFDSLIAHLRTTSGVSLLGASFGGALALLLSAKHQVKKTLLISPLLDLAHQRERGGSDFRDWFDSKFSSVDHQDLTLSELARKISFADERLRVCLIYGAQDEVLGQDMFTQFSDYLRSQSYHSVHKHDGPHQPITYRDVIFQLTQSYKFLVESTDAVCRSAMAD